MKKNKKIIITIGIVGIIALMVGIIIVPILNKKTNVDYSNINRNSQLNKYRLFLLLNSFDFEIKDKYIKSKKTFRYKRGTEPYYIIFTNITENTFTVHINDFLNSKIGIGEYNKKQVEINFDDSKFIEPDKKAKKRFFLSIKNWFNTKDKIIVNDEKIESIKVNFKEWDFEEKNRILKEIKLLLTNELKKLIKDIKLYKIIFEYIEKKINLSNNFLDKFNFEGTLLIDKKNSLIEINDVKKFLNFILKNKVKIQNKIKLNYINNILNKFDNKVKKLIIKFIFKSLELSDLKKLTDIKFMYNANYYKNDGSIVEDVKTNSEKLEQIKIFVELVDKYKEKLENILYIKEINVILYSNKKKVKNIIKGFKDKKLFESDFNSKLIGNKTFNTNYFSIDGSISESVKSDSKILRNIKTFIVLVEKDWTNLKLKLDNKLVLEINNNLTNEIKNIIKGFKDKKLFESDFDSKLIGNKTFNTNYFSIDGSISESVKSNSEILRNIKIFIDLVKQDKTNLKIKLDNKLVLEINNNLTNEIKNIIKGFKDKKLFESDFDSKLIGNKTFNTNYFSIDGSISESVKFNSEILRNIKTFIDLVKQDKTNLKTKLDEKNLLNQRTQLTSDISTKLNNEIQQIILRLSTRTNGFLGLINKPENISFNKDDFVFVNSKVSFKLGKKTHKKLQSILNFINYINNNKTVIKTKLDEEDLLNQRTQLALDINTKLNNEIQQIILRLSTRTNGFLGLKNKPENISFNKKDFSIDGSIVTFLIGDKTKDKLQSILNFINYINNNKTVIKTKLDEEDLLNKRTQLALDINTKLNNEIQQIILRLSTRTNGFLGLINKPENISFNKKDFLIDGSIVTFVIGDKTKDKLQSILNFINYINNNKTAIKTKLDEEDLLNKRTQLALDINTKLNNEIQQIILRLSTRTNGFLGLINKPENISFNKKDFSIDGSIVTFLIGDKTKDKLQSILNFINYINNNKTVIKTKLDEEDLLNQRTQLALDINTKLNNEIQQIILRLSTRTNGFLGLINKPENISFNKKDFLIDGSIVTFVIGDKTKDKLQYILNFINYINNNKTAIKTKLDEEDLLNKRTQLALDINTKLNNEIQQIILRLSTRTNGFLGLINKPENISFNKKDFLIDGSIVTFVIGDKTKDKLQYILNFINYINNNKTAIKTKLDEEDLLNKRTQLALDINTKLNNEIQQIILRLSTRTNGFLGLINKPENISFNKKDFSIDGSIVTFVIGDKTKDKLQSILNFINYINNNKTAIKTKLDEEDLLNKRTQLALDINTKLNNEIQQIILRLSTRTNGFLGLINKPENISFNKKDFLIDGSIVTFVIGDKTKDKLQYILNFINYINNNKTAIKTKLDEEDLLNKRTQLALDINTKLNNEIQQIILRLSTRTNGFLGLINKPENISFNKKDFSIDGSIVTFVIGDKTKDKLQSILNFINYINNNKTAIKTKLDEEDLLNKRTQLALDINTKLNNEIQQIILRLSTRTNGFLGLINKPENISFNKKDFLIDGSIVTFVIGDKTKDKLQYILNFINYINNNKTAIKTKLDEEDLLNKRTQLALDINTKLNNEIQQIILRLSTRTNGFLGLINKPENISFNKKDFLIDGSIVTFVIGDKTKDKLQYILNFINYINNNKTAIKTKLDEEDLLNKRTQLALDINTKLNNEIQQIILRLSTRTNGFLGLINKPENISFNKKDFLIDGSIVTFVIGDKTKDKLQYILNFINYINNNKTAIKTKLDEEDLLNKRTQLALDINTKLNNEIQQIILRLSTRTNGFLGLINKPENISFNKKDFLIDGSIVTFVIGDKTKDKLQYILNFINYINNNKTAIKTKLDEEDLLNKRTQLALDINTKLNNEIQQIILRLSTRTNGFLGLINKPENISFNKKDFSIDGSIVTFVIGDKTKDKLQSILNFINYINNNKTAIKTKLDNELVLEINNNLTDEIKNIIKGFKDKKLFESDFDSKLIGNKTFNTNYFSIDGSISESVKSNSEILRNIKIFIDLVKQDKTNLKIKLDNKLVLEINNNLTDEIKNIIKGFKDKKLFESDFDSKLIGNKTFNTNYFSIDGSISESVKSNSEILRNIKIFIDLVKQDKTNLKIKLDNKLVLEINNNLTNEIKNIIKGFKDKKLFESDFDSKLIGNKTFNTNYFSIDGSISESVKSNSEILRNIKIFIDLVKQDKTNLKIKLDNKLVLEINNNLTDEIKNIIKGFKDKKLFESDFDSKLIGNKTFNTNYFSIDGSISESVKSNSEILRNIKIFIDLVKQDKTNLKIKLDNKLVLEINNNLTDEIKNIIKGFKDKKLFESDFDSKLIGNKTFNTNYFSIDGSIFESVKSNSEILRNIKIFIDLVKQDKTNLKIKLDNKLVLEINNNLTDEIKNIIKGFKDKKLFESDFDSKLIGNKTFNTNYFSIDGSISESVKSNSEILRNIKIFIDLVKQDKTNLKIKLDNKLVLEINNNLTDEIKNIIKGFKDKKLFESDFDSKLIGNKTFNTNYFSIDGSISESVKSNSEILRNIKIFIDLVKQDKTNLKIKLDNKLVLEINNNLTDEIKNIIKGFKDKKLFESDFDSKLIGNKTFNTNYFSIDGSISESVKSNSEILRNIKIFIDLVKQDKTNLKIKLDNKLVLEINNNLTDEIKNIIKGFKDKKLFESDFDSKLIGNKTFNTNYFSIDGSISESVKSNSEILRNIKIFIDLVKQDKTNLKIKLDEKNLLNLRTQLTSNINTKLTDKVKQILIYLNEDNLFVSIFPLYWNNERKNLFKEFIFVENKEVSFSMGERTKEELQSILRFINYINTNKKIILDQLIRIILTNEIKNEILNQQVVQILVYIFNNKEKISELLNPEFPEDLDLTQYRFFSFSGSSVTFSMGDKTKDKLQSILNFINYINNYGKEALKSLIELKLNNEIQQIILRLSTRTNGFLGLINKPENISFNKKDFSINGSIVSFDIGEKTVEELIHILDFLNYVNDNKIDIQKQLDNEQKNKLVLDINTKLNNEIQQIILRLSTRTNGFLGLINKPENISFNKKDFSINGSIVSFDIGEKTVEELIHILDFINYINNNKTAIKTKLDEEDLLNQRTQLTSDINTKLNNEIKRIILRLSTRTKGILELPELPTNISFNKDDFSINGSIVSFDIGEKTVEELIHILDFINYINNNKTAIKTKLDEEDLLNQRTQLTSDINTKLNNEIKRIILRLSTRTKGILELPELPTNISFNKDDFSINGSIVSFDIGEKTVEELIHILDFINYINNNKTAIKTKLDEEDLLNQRTQLTSDINTKLNNEIKRIILRLSTRTKGILELPELPTNISFNKDDFSINGSIVSFDIGEKTVEELIHILDFINYINNNKTAIKTKLDEEDLLNQRTQLTSDINTKLNNEIKRIILRLSTRTKGILELPELPTNISFNKDDFSINGSIVSFDIGEKTVEELIHILDFINYINNNKTAIKTKLDEEDLLNQRTQLTSDISTKLNNEIQQIILRLSTRTNGFLGLINKPENISFNKKDFSINGSIVSFDIGEKTVEELIHILDFLNYVNDNKIDIQKQLDNEQKNKLVLDINTKLNNEIQQIILRLSTRTNGFLGLINKPENISFNKKDFSINGSIVSFDIGEKTAEELIHILDFLNYVNDNKIDIQKQLDNEQKNKLVLDINTKLNNEIQQIISKLSTRTIEYPWLTVELFFENWFPEREVNFNKEDFSIDGSIVTFEMGEKTEEELQSILDFLSLFDDSGFLDEIKQNLEIEYFLKQIDIILRENENEVQNLISKLIVDTTAFEIIKKYLSKEEETYNIKEFHNPNGSLKYEKNSIFFYTVGRTQFNFVKTVSEKKDELNNYWKEKLVLDINKKLIDQDILIIMNKLQKKENIFEELSILDSLGNQINLPNYNYNENDFNIEILSNQKKKFKVKPEKTKEELQSILDFLNYIKKYYNKITSVFEQQNQEKIEQQNILLREIKEIFNYKLENTIKVKWIIKAFIEKKIILNDFTDSTEIIFKSNYYINDGFITIKEIIKTDLIKLREIKRFVEFVKENIEIIQKQIIVNNINNLLKIESLINKISTLHWSRQYVYLSFSQKQLMNDNFVNGIFKENGNSLTLSEVLNIKKIMDLIIQKELKILDFTVYEHGYLKIFIENNEAIMRIFWAFRNEKIIRKDILKISIHWIREWWINKKQFTEFNDSKDLPVFYTEPSWFGLRNSSSYKEMVKDLIKKDENNNNKTLLFSLIQLLDEREQ